MPQVSIITPCYNSSEFLEETIQSVLYQNFTDWEWIIT
ncbi:MAG: glycosyltransferase, partial [Cloacibacterium normanense]